MSLSLEQIHTIARLAKLSLNEQEATRMQQHLNDFFASVVSPMQAVDTSNIVPLITAMATRKIFCRIKSKRNSKE